MIQSLLLKPEPNSLNRVRHIYREMFVFVGLYQRRQYIQPIPFRRSFISAP